MKIPTNDHHHHHHHPLLLLLGQYPIWIGLTIRLFLAWFLPFLLDDGRFIPGVAYTDIDYYVFTDAAEYIQKEQSPFARHTYRYTPFLAELLSHLPHQRILARYIFCIADTICGWIILEYRTSIRGQKQQQQQQQQEGEHDEILSTNDNIWYKLQDAMWWLYNPLAINICTRGSSDSLQVLLPVLLTLRTVTYEGTTTTSDTTTTTTTTQWKQAFMAGIWHGIAVHSKLYPIIYSLSFISYFATRGSNEKRITNTIVNNNNNNNNNKESLPPSFPWTEPGRLFRLIRLWVKRLLSPAPLIFFITFVTTFAGLTYLAVLWYGTIALDEGLLYHFSRVDHRHNYSMFWYWIYLTRAAVAQALVAATTPTSSSSAAALSWIGRLLLIPQMVLLVYSSLGIAPYNLSLALFVQTYLFVTHNKVITAQYFSWYLCLLPLCSNSFSFTKRVKVALLGLGVSILLWLGSAYCLEMQGMAVHKIVWIMSIIHFWANVNLLGALLSSSSSSSSSSATTTRPTYTAKIGSKED